MAIRLAHGWRMRLVAGLPERMIREFIRPSLRAVPQSLAVRLPGCTIALLPQLESPESSSCWTETAEGIDVALAYEGREPHDVGMELLTCLGQALWERTSANEEEEYLQMLRVEIEAGVPGEIDEEAVHEKSLLFASAAAASSIRNLERYARASFAGTAAEYIHCLWHDVTVRQGVEHLPAERLRRRLELLARWFPPDRGYRLFPRRR